jgi:4'-phosphopantetheinyl transferase EntD
MSFTFSYKSSQLKAMCPYTQQLDSFKQFTLESIDEAPAVEDAQLGHVHEWETGGHDELTQLPS